jgi:KDO2-lipid IV(A) lauroyltransferase
LAWIVGDLLGVRRRHVVASMRRASVRAPARTARRMYRSLGRGVFELLALSLAPARRARVAGLGEALDLVRQRREAAQGRAGGAARGVVVAAAHTGNWDLVACSLAEHVRVTVITKRLSVGWLNRWWQALRVNRGVHLVEAGAAARRASSELARGGWVVAMMDQAPERARAVVSTEFLGAVADVDLTPALLAVRAGCPLVVAFPYRTRSGHAVALAGVLYPPTKADRAWACRAMIQATQWLERFVREHPEQWLWMHRRWKRPLDEDPRHAKC